MEKQLEICVVLTPLKIVILRRAEKCSEEILSAVYYIMQPRKIVNIKNVSQATNECKKK
jgi:hypothetical protein